MRATTADGHSLIQRLDHLRPSVYYPYRAIACAIIAFISIRQPVQACAPGFPQRLLNDRQTTMARLPETSFYLQAARLVKPITGLAVESFKDNGYFAPDPQTLIDQRNDAEKKGLSAHAWDEVQRLRALSPSDLAQAKTDLPDEIHWYLAGAAAFKQGDDTQAQNFFQQVLALPANQQHQHSLWAQYMLARSLSRSGDHIGALQHFAKVRARVIAGEPDELHLAIASLGEEALIYKAQQNTHMQVQRYAEQTAHGDPVGLDSLKQIIHPLMDQAVQNPALVQDPLIAQLITAWLVSTFYSYGANNLRSNWEPDKESDTLAPPVRQQYEQLLQILSQTKTMTPIQAEGLAALLYQNARYEDVKRLLPEAGNGGMAWWLRAKMAVRANDVASARAAYANAAKAFPPNQEWLESEAFSDDQAESPYCRVNGENAILSLRQGDYIEAFDQMWQGRARYWQDAADIAERVLTLDELKHYVDMHVPAPSAASLKALGDDTSSGAFLPPELELREVLGRRMLRENRYHGALDYFRPSLQPLVKQYIEARQTADSRWHTRIGKAAALYTAANLLYNKGIDLIGYSSSPDYAIFGGSFGDADPLVKAGPWVTAAEVERQRISESRPNIHLHEEKIAIQLAGQAADLLPKRSQAFAAVLCHASDWTGEDSKTRISLYHRYLAEGAYQPWASAFGQHHNLCPTPDFKQARTHLIKYWWYDIKPTLRPYKHWLYGGLALLIAAFAGLLYRIFRKQPRV